MCHEGQSLLIDRGKGEMSAQVLREQHLGRHFSFGRLQQPAIRTLFYMENQFVASAAV